MIAPITLKSTCTAATRFAANEPAKLASTAVIVVPILSPKSTGSAPCKLIKSLAKNPCKIPIVALEL